MELMEISLDLYLKATRRFAETDTVLYSLMAVEPGESWMEYIDRIGTLLSGTEVQVIFRPKLFPESFKDCRAMLHHWHDFTS